MRIKEVSCMDHYEYKIYSELMKRGMTLESIYSGHYPESDIVRELSHESTTWGFNTTELIDVRNWNLNSLDLENPKLYIRYNMPYEVNFRKPKAYFELFLTSQDNLVLDWYPYDPKSPRRSTVSDWSHWDNRWQDGGYLPFNRILMLRKVEHILIGYKGKRYDKIDQFILRWIKHLIDEIYSYLERFIEIVKITDLYLEYKEDQPRILDKIVGCEIKNVKKAEKEIKLQKKMKCITDTCSKVKISPNQFLKVFNEKGMKFAPTANAIATKSAKLSASMVKKLAIELYGFPEIYDSIINQPPPGIEPRNKGAEIIKFKK